MKKCKKITYFTHQNIENISNVFSWLHFGKSWFLDFWLLSVWAQEKKSRIISSRNRFAKMLPRGNIWNMPIYFYERVLTYPGILKILRIESWIRAYFSTSEIRNLFLKYGLLRTFSPFFYFFLLKICIQNWSNKKKKKSFHFLRLIPLSSDRRKTSTEWLWGVGQFTTLLINLSVQEKHKPTRRNVFSERPGLARNRVLMKTLFKYSTPPKNTKSLFSLSQLLSNFLWFFKK